MIAHELNLLILAVGGLVGENEMGSEFRLGKLLLISIENRLLGVELIGDGLVDKAMT